MATSSFRLDLERFAEKAGDRATEVVRKVAIEVLSSVVLKSPVDTGRFRGNWNVAYGGIDYSTDSAEDKNGSAAIYRGVSYLLSSNLPGATIYITNNLPYAHRLEDGYSKQAPNGMVRLTVVEFNQFVKRALA